MVKISVYGAEVTCASCVGSPSSIETYEWLQAAIGRKYPNSSFEFEYIDIFSTQNEKEKQIFVKRILDEDLFYPVVLVNETIVGEGNPRLKKVYEEIEKYIAQ